MKALEKSAWSPYAVGAGIGALSWFTFLSARKGLGVSTPFEGTAAALARNLAPEATQVNAYLAVVDEPPKLDWELMLDAGIVIGSLLSVAASGDKPGQSVPGRWARRFGPAPSTRYAGAFLGGALAMFGARMARGCTSGHGISGNLQLASSSLLFTPVMGLSAVWVARSLFGQRRSE